ncbi:MAG: DEAD/DEAH box helicase, partial [Thalassolituus sp.]
EHQQKVDFKVKAKQYVKIYSQMASIMPYEVADWEKLFWFLKFLIPKLKLQDPQADSIDELLDSVDLSSYGLERDRLGQSIGLDSSETELDPQNPNTRGGHGTESEENPLDEIVRTFNERWFQGWSATPEEQRVKYISLKEGVSNHPDFEEKYLNDSDPQNRNLALDKIVKEVMLNKRKDDMELYRLFFGDDAFRSALVKSLENSFLKVW